MTDAQKFLASERYVVVVLIPISIGMGILASHFFHLDRPWWWFALIYFGGSLSWSVCKYLYLLFRGSR